MSNVKVAIVEDDKEMLALLSTTIAKDGSIEITATFTNGNSFIDAFDMLDIDVVLMDIGLPDVSGIECVRKCKAMKPQVQFMMSTVLDNPKSIFDSLCAGATGYLIKSSDQLEICACIHELHKGGAPMSMPIARLVVNYFSQNNITKQSDVLNVLTTREYEILEMQARGLMYKEIATKIFLSPATVRTHIKNIYEKLHVHSKIDAINKLYNSGNA